MVYFVGKQHITSFPQEDGTALTKPKLNLTSCESWSKSLIYSLVAV